jgi:hypothetical protein
VLVECDQLQSRKEKAVSFTRDVLGDPDRTEEIAEEQRALAGRNCSISGSQEFLNKSLIRKRRPSPGCAL